jgi:hypothetical protein
MLTPIDGWTLAHGLVGFFLGKIRFQRLLFYPVPIVWEVYQLFFHYQPQSLDLARVWLNSVSDILACIICYEIAVKHSFHYERHRLWLSISTNAKAVIAYVIITLVVTWTFWDDIFRIGLSARMPSAQVPLIMGALSPAIASFIVRKWINREASQTARLPWLSFGPWSYYLFAGLLPSVAIMLVIVLVRGFRFAF